MDAKDDCDPLVGEPISSTSPSISSHQQVPSKATQPSDIHNLPEKFSITNSALDAKSGFTHPSTKLSGDDDQMPPPLSTGGQIRPYNQSNLTNVMDHDEQEEADEDSEDESDSDEDDDGVEEVGMDDSDDEDAEDDAEVSITLISEQLLVALRLSCLVELTDVGKLKLTLNFSTTRQFVKFLIYENSTDLQEDEDSDDGDDDEDKEDEEEDDSDEDAEDSDDEEDDEDEEEGEEEEADPLNVSSSMLGGDSETSAMSEDVSLPSSVSITPVSSLVKKPVAQSKQGTIYT